MATNISARPTTSREYARQSSAPNSHCAFAFSCSLMVSLRSKDVSGDDFRDVRAAEFGGRETEARLRLPT